MPAVDTITGLQLDVVIKGCVNGDKSAQTQLYKQFADTMFSVCLRYCRNREEAEEVLQEGFMKVFKYVHQFKFEGSFEGWMKRIMVNCALKTYRNKSQLYPVVNIENSALAEVGREEIIAQIGAKEMLKMVQQLPPACRMVFNLYVFEGMKHREIAEQLGISEGTSKSNLYDARAMLQKWVTNSLQVSKRKCS